jgi:hypothetical protein
MLKFKLNIECGNAAFVDDQNAEIARILRAVAADLEADTSGRLYEQHFRDSNGNRVGSFKLFKGRAEKC